MVSKKVGTILIDKVKPEIVQRYLKQFGLDVGGSLQEQVTRLETHQKKVPKKELGECEDCHGTSDLREPMCVYCGAGGDEENQLQEAVAANPHATMNPVVEVVQQPETTVKRRSGAKGEIVPVSSAVVTVTLDENVREIRFLQREAVVSYWRLGHAIYVNFRQRLYTQRLGDDGKPQYKAFNQFVQHELGITAAHAYHMMDAAVNFTEDEVAELGVNKLALVAKVPKADRAELLARIRSTAATRDEVAEEVRRLVGGKRQAPSAAQQAGSTKGVKGAVRVPKAKEITVGVVLGKKTIHMVRKDDPDKQASTFQHQPYCEEQMLNGVVTSYRVIKTETGIALVIERRRETVVASSSTGKAKRSAPKKK